MPTKQTIWSRNYAERAYARLAVTIPKARKDDVERFAVSKGESVNGLINRLLRTELRISEEEWKK